MVAVERDGLLFEPSDRRRVLRVVQADDPVARGHQREPVAVGHGLGPFLQVGGVGHGHGCLEAVEDQPIDFVLRPGQIEPPIRVGPVARGELAEDGRGVVIGIDRQAGEEDVRPGQIALDRFHLRRNHGARARASAEHERDDPGAIGEVGVGHGSAGALDQSERCQGLAEVAEMLAGRADIGTGRHGGGADQDRRRDRDGHDGEAEAIGGVHEITRAGAGGRPSEDSGSSCDSWSSAVVCMAMSGYRAVVKITARMPAGTSM